MITLWLVSLWAGSVRGGAALLVAWVVCRIPMVPAFVRCWVWRSAYGALLVSLVWTAPVNLPLLHAAIVSPKPIPSEVGNSSAMEPTIADNPIAAQQQDPHSGLDIAPAVTAAQRSNRAWPLIAFSLWLAFVAGYAGRLAMGWLRAMRLRKGRLVNVPELARLCQAMGINVPPAVRTHSAVRGPLLLGAWRPVIVLPESMVGSTHLRLILAHELAHLRRQDLMWNWLPTLAMAALPFHPLVWVCNRQWRLVTEAACDADAVAITAVRPAEYGRVLVNVATHLTPRAAGVLSVAVAAESRWLLRERLKMMTNNSHWNQGRIVIAGLIVGVFTIVAAVPWRVVAQQPAAGGMASGTSTSTTAQAIPFTTEADEGYKQMVARLWEEKYAPQVISRNGKALNLDTVKEAFNNEVAHLPHAGATSTAPEGASSDSNNATAIGRIALPMANIRSRLSGTIEREEFAAGQTVKKGDILIQFESKAQVGAVTSASEILKTTEQRYAQLEEHYRVGLNSDLDVSQAKLEVDKARDVLRQRETELESTRVTAPFDGILGNLAYSAGSTVFPGDPIATVFDTTRTTVEFAVPADSARALKPGVPIEIAAADISKTLGRGEITSTGPDVDSATGMMRIQAKLTASNRALVPGEIVNVRFHAGR